VLMGGAGGLLRALPHRLLEEVGRAYSATGPLRSAIGLPAPAPCAARST
jgi:hypothetical protein